MSTAAKYNRGSVITLGTLASDAVKVSPAPASPVVTRAKPVIPNTEALTDPKLIGRLLVSLHEQMREIESAIGSHILGGGNLIKNVAVTANKTVTIAHRLGREYVGYIVTRSKLTSGTASPAMEQTLASGQTADKYLALQTTFTGTIQVYVF